MYQSSPMHRPEIGLSCDNKDSSGELQAWMHSLLCVPVSTAGTQRVKQQAERQFQGINDRAGLDLDRS